VKPAHLDSTDYFETMRPMRWSAPLSSKRDRMVDPAESRGENWRKKCDVVKKEIRVNV